LKRINEDGWLIESAGLLETLNVGDTLETGEIENRLSLAPSTIDLWAPSAPPSLRTVSVGRRPLPDIPPGRRGRRIHFARCRRE